MLSPVTWPVCAGGVPVSAEAAGRFLGGSTSRVIRGSYVGNCGTAVSARWFWWVTSRRSRRWVRRRRIGGI